MNYATKLWKGQIFASLGTPKSCGVAICVKKDIVTNINCAHRDDNGRILVLDFVFCKREYRLINIYASNKEGERKKMFKEIEKWCVKDCVIID